MTPKQSTSPPEQAVLLKAIETVELIDTTRRHRQVTQTIIDILSNNQNLSFKEDDKKVMEKYTEKIGSCYNPDSNSLNDELIAIHLNGILSFINTLISLKEQLQNAITSQNMITNALERLTQDTRFTFHQRNINNLIQTIKKLPVEIITEKDIKRFNEDTEIINNYMNNHDGSQKNKQKNSMIQLVNGLEVYLTYRSK